MVSWRQETDYLRCSPKFHGRPRYDCILFQKQEASLRRDQMHGKAFGRLLLLFTWEGFEEKYSLALVQPFDVGVNSHRVQRLDQDLEFIRVKERPQRESIVCSIHSIIRGAAAIPDSRRSGEYVIMDTLDTDSFLRIKEFY